MATIQDEGLQFTAGTTINFVNNGVAYIDMKFVGASEDNTAFISAPNSNPNKLKAFLLSDTTLLTRIKFNKPEQPPADTVTLTAFPTTRISGAMIANAIKDAQASGSTPGYTTNWDDGKPPLVSRVPPPWETPEYPGQQSVWHWKNCACVTCAQWLNAGNGNFGHYSYGVPVRA